MAASSEESMDHLVRGFGQALGGVPAAAVRRYVETGEGDLPDRAALLHWDVNSVHGFVFDTTNATAVRGASEILKKLDRDLRDGRVLGIQREQVLYAGGGAGVAVVAGADAGALRDRLHAELVERTRVATASVTDVPLIAGGQSFGERLQEAGRRLARERFLSGASAEALVPFFALRCDICGRRAASERVDRRDEKGRLECAPCKLCIDRGREARRYEREPSDFDDLQDDNGDLGVVYLDGNGVGKAIRGLKSPLEYAGFSRALARLVEKAIGSVAARWSLEDDPQGPGEGPRGRRRRRSYQLPIQGGDDVVAILPGALALVFARGLLAEIEAHAAEIPELKVSSAPLGASAGVAIAGSGYPIRHLLAEAEGLLHQAKRRVYEAAGSGGAGGGEGGAVRSALAFRVVTEGSPRSEEEEPERWRKGRDELLFTGCPYSLPELDRFLERLELLGGGGGARSPQGIGRSQLYALCRVARRGRAQLRNHILYQIGRSEDWQRLARRLGGFGGDEPLAADRCVEAFVPCYGGRPVLDVADMVQLLGRGPGLDGQEIP
jgi:hypothetical protein